MAGKNTTEIKTEPQNEAAQKKSFFSKLLSFLFGTDSSSSANELKSLNKQLQKAGYHYYNMGQERLTSNFAEMLFKVYENVAPLREYFLNNNNDEYFAKMTIMFFLTEEQKGKLAFISPDNIEKLVGTVSIAKLSEEVKNAIIDFEHKFNAEFVREIDETYNAFLTLKQLCLIDYYVILKAFSAELKENAFAEKVKFYPCLAKPLTDKILDFFTAAESFLTIDNWKLVVDFVSTLPGVKGFDEKSFMSLQALLLVMGDACVFPRLAKIISHDNNFQIQPVIYNKEIVRPYLENQRAEVKETLAAMFTNFKNGKIQEQEKKTFPEFKVMPLPNYNFNESSMFEELGVNGYTHFRELMYLKAYFDAYVKTEVYEFMDVFTVRATTSTPTFVTDLSVAYHDLLDALKNLEKDDAQLDQKFPLGYRIHSFAQKMRTDPDMSFNLNLEINKINADMEKTLNTSMDRLRKIYAGIRELADDRINNGKLVENWEDVERYIPTPLVPLLNSIISHTDDFLTLMKLVK